MQELGACDFPNELRIELRKLLEKTITCLLSLLEKKNTLGRILLPTWVSRKLAKTSMKSLKPPIWGTHIRWMKLCPVAWQIVIDGRYPLQEYSTPEIVEKCGKKQHNELLHVVEDWIKRKKETLIYKHESETKTSFYVSLNDEWREIVIKPDGYALFNTHTPHGPVNLLIEATTRSPNYIPDEWLTSYMIPYYLNNLRSTFVLLVTPFETQIYPLTIRGLKKFERLLRSPLKRDVNPQTCSNCDLRSICPEPII